MSESQKISFKKPPLREVSISIQFEAIEGLHLGYLGLLWNAYRDRYQDVSSATELPHVVERFGVNTQSENRMFEFQTEPRPRLKFANADDESLIQIQRDRFIYNWRNYEKGVEYPRYERVRSRFMAEFSVFSEFLKSNKLPMISIDQVELTYVNHIHIEDLKISEVFNAVVHESALQGEVNLESYSLNLKHIIEHDETKIGRAYTSIEQANLVSDGSPICVLKLHTRAHPPSNNSEGVIAVMNILRNEINQNFTRLTTEKMHKAWERI